MRFVYLYIFFVIHSFVDCCLCRRIRKPRPSVQTRYGIYIGQIRKSRSGYSDIIAYKGIPYAQPPVGKLRFMEPVELEESKTVYDGTQENACLQLEFTPSGDSRNFEGSEDCLYLNVYVPRKKVNKLLPVYVWIHGGAWITGSGSELTAGPNYFLDENRDLIMVAMNYRLGVLGFLSANDVNIPGNLGLKDQNMALKWVKNNIKAFGGDSNSITIGGYSAGGASVSLHLYSKASKGLFQRAISQSGTLDCSWAMKPVNEAREIARKIISYLNCSAEPNELLECLQILPPETILFSLDAVKVANTSFIMYVSPVLELDGPSAFITKESVAEGSNIPWLSGLVSEEGLVFYQFLAVHSPGYLDLSILKTKFNELLPVTAYYEFSPDSDKISDELRNYYFSDEPLGPASAKYFVKILSDRMFNHGFHKTTRNYKGRLYNYLLSYRGNHSVAVVRPSGLEKAVSHADDNLYFFNTILLNGNLTGEDLEESKTLVRMWYNFITKGDPTPVTHEWAESNGGTKYMEFANDGRFMRSNMFNNRMEYLDSLDKKWKFHNDA